MDIVIKPGHTIELLPPVVTIPWSLDQLRLLLKSLVASRRFGRFALVKASISSSDQQTAKSLPYTQYALQSSARGHRGYGRFLRYTRRGSRQVRRYWHNDRAD